MLDINYTKFVIRRPYLVMVGVLIALSLLAVGAGHLRFTSDYKIYFSKHNASLQAYENIQNQYTKNENILFVVAPKDKNVFSHNNLEAIQKITDLAWKLPFSVRVDSITNYQFSKSKNNNIVIEQLPANSQKMTLNEINDFKQRVLAESELANRLISKDGHTTGINVSINIPDNDPEKTANVVAKARSLVNEINNKYKNLDIYMTGTIVFNNAFPEVSKQDMTVLVSIMYLIVFAVVIWYLRSIVATFGVMLVTILSIAGAFGVIGWLGFNLNPATASAPTIILTLAIANGVHMFTSFFSFVDDGAEKNEAIIKAVKKNLLPITLTDVTTIIGFLCLNFSDSPPFHDLGNTVAIGIVCIYLMSLIFLPALMSVLKIDRSKTMRAVRWTENLSSFVINNSNKLIIIVLTMGAILSYCITFNRIDDSFVNYFDKTIDFRRATDYTVKNLTGIYTIQYSLPAGGENGVYDPDYLNNVEKLADWYRTQPETIHVSAVTDTVKRLNKTVNNDDESQYVIPHDRKRIAEDLLLYEMSLPYGLGLDNQININKSATRLTVILKNLSTQQLLALEARANSWIAKNVSSWNHVIAASPNLMFAHISHKNVKSMLLGNVVALFFISILIILSLKNYNVGIIAVLTNLLPPAMAFGLWGILYKEVGLSLSVVTSMTLGIIVDDTVYFLSSYFSYRKEQNSPEESIRKTFNSVGRALWITSVALTAGFMVLTLSHFKLNSSMGLLTSITIVFAALADFILLPAVILYLEKSKSKAEVLDFAKEETY